MSRAMKKLRVRAAVKRVFDAPLCLHLLDDLDPNDLVGQRMRRWMIAMTVFLFALAPISIVCIVAGIMDIVAVLTST